MTIYPKTPAQNSCAPKPKKIYITQRPKIKDFHDLADFTFKRRCAKPLILLRPISLKPTPMTPPANPPPHPHRPNGRRHIST
jgi:hypothetical protein